MRLLFLTPQLPFPPRQGTALRNWGLLQHLAAQGHHIELLSFDERLQPATALPAELGETCRRVVTVPVPRRETRERLRALLTSALPDMAWRLWSQPFRRALQATLRDHHFDVVQFEGIELARYMLDLANRSIIRPGRLIFDDHNCEYVLQQRTFLMDLRAPWRWHGAAYSFVQWQRLRRFEQRALRVANATLCVSPQDRDALRRLDARAALHVIPNGINVAEYDSMPPAAGDRPPSVVFTGKMDFRPNVAAMLWFWRDIWSMVRQAHPQARLLVVGQKPSPRLAPLRRDPSVTLTGEVEDTRPYIAQADVYIAPLLAGGGTRFKLLEAMAMRKAIVTTSLGCEGFDIESGREAIIADGATEFASAVNDLLRSPSRRHELGERAHRFVASAWDWKMIIPRLEQVYRRG